MDNKGKGWLIAVVVVAILCAIGSCDSGSNTKGERHQGICSHCHGSGRTEYGKECGWCDGYGFWTFYD